VSCASPGNCAAGGSYRRRSGDHEPFVVSEQNGHWNAAIEVPGLTSLNSGGFAEVLSVSCGSVGNCVAGGYADGKGGASNRQAFVVSETGGH
jgi:hypothetical protein